MRAEAAIVRLDLSFLGRIYRIAIGFGVRRWEESQARISCSLTAEWIGAECISWVGCSKQLCNGTRMEVRAGSCRGVHQITLVG